MRNLNRYTIQIIHTYKGDHNSHLLYGYCTCICISKKMSINSNTRIFSGPRINMYAGSIGIVRENNSNYHQNYYYMNGLAVTIHRLFKLCVASRQPHDHYELHLSIDSNYMYHFGFDALLVPLYLVSTIFNIILSNNNKPPDIVKNMCKHVIKTQSTLYDSYCTIM
jgi:hypothetical protein